MKIRGALRYLDRVGAPFLFLEERTVSVRRGEQRVVANTLPKLVFAIEGSIKHQLPGAEVTVLKPGSVLINLERGRHVYLPEADAVSRLRVLRVTFPWQPEDAGADFMRYIRQQLPAQGVVSMGASRSWAELLQSCRAALYSRKLDCRFRAQALLQSAILDIVARVETEAHHSAPSNPAQSLVDRTEAYLEDHLDRALRLSEIAGFVNRSEEHLSRLYHRQTGHTIFQKLRRFRMDRAAYLLQCTELSISEIARQTGHQTLAHFSRCFKEDYGRPPLIFRQQVGGPAS